MQRHLLLRGSAMVLALAVLCTMTVAPNAVAQQQDQQSSDTGFVFKASSELVLVNVIARDKQGNLVRDLKPEDFTLYEDGKAQKISTFDLEDIETAAATSVTGGTASTNLLKKGASVDASTLKNHRLVVLFYDFVSMQPEDVERAVDASINYIDKQMTDADLVAILSLSSSLVLNQDFTKDRALLKSKLQAFTTSSGAGFENGGDGSSDGTPDTGAAYLPDDSEFNTFNNDRRLQAIQAIVGGLAKIQEKKSLIYFSSGLSSTGLENEAALRNATNAARRANTAIYTLDSRGLEAMPPSGDASTASLRGTAAYSGAAVRNQFSSNESSQETLSTLADDTGGKAFLDTNDFSGVFTQVQRDSSAYYVLGFRSSNPVKDGRYRKLAVKVSRPGIKLEYRNGYYAGKDFHHFNKEDREAQLEDELNSQLSSTDVALYIGASYFRLSDDRFYVPVSLVVPGSQIPFVSGGDKEKATIDVLGVVRDELGRPIGNARQTVKLDLDAAQQVHRKNVQYNTAFVLPSGNYKLKFVVRENQTGRLGSFETEIRIPDLKHDKVPVRMSSIVLSNTVAPATAKKSAKEDPLVYQGRQIVPNIAHVFSTDQNLYFHYEVYDPAKAKGANDDSKSGVRVLTSIQFFQGNTKVFETPLVEADRLNAPERKANVFDFQIPLDKLKPGYYTCQISVIDDAAGAFVFPRTPMLIKAATQPTTPPAQPTGD